MWKKTLKDQRGATIVEVAVLVPMIWIVVLVCILLLFFLLDMGSARSEAIFSANEVAAEWRKSEHKSIKEEQGLLRNRLKKKLVVSNLQSESISVSFDMVTVKTVLGFKLAGHDLQFSNTAKAAVDNREKWIRVLSH